MNTKNMQTEDLKAMRDALLEEIATIKTQIDRAKSHAAATGEYSEREWFNKAKEALRMKNVRHQFVCRELGERSREERRKRNELVGNKFIEVARRRLDGDVFAALWDETNAGAE